MAPSSPRSATRGQGGEERRLDYGYWQIDNPPERIARATLALEDRRFWSHPGVDPVALLRAVWRRLGAQRPLRRLDHRDADRADAGSGAAHASGAKAREAATALALTWRYGRAALLAHYLRIAPYGNGSHGIAHAARFYFDKPAEDLSWAEIALLVRRAAIADAAQSAAPGRALRARRGAAPARSTSLRARASSMAPNSRWRIASSPRWSPQPAPRRPDALHLVLRYEKLVEGISAARLRPAPARDHRSRHRSGRSRRWRGAILRSGAAQGARAGRGDGGRARDAAPCSPISAPAITRAAMPARSTLRRSSARRAAR